MEPKYTTEQILRHMAPSTLASWISNMDIDPEALEVEDVILMHAAVTELFNIVGMEEALKMLEAHSVYDDNPLVAEVVEAYNEGGE